MRWWFASVNDAS